MTSLAAFFWPSHACSRSHTTVQTLFDSFHHWVTVLARIPALHVSHARNVTVLPHSVRNSPFQARWSRLSCFSPICLSDGPGFRLLAVSSARYEAFVVLEMIDAFPLSSKSCRTWFGCSLQHFTATAKNNTWQGDSNFRSDF